MPPARLPYFHSWFQAATKLALIISFTSLKAMVFHSATNSLLGSQVATTSVGNYSQVSACLAINSLFAGLASRWLSLVSASIRLTLFSSFVVWLVTWNCFAYVSANFCCLGGLIQSHCHYYLGLLLEIHCSLQPHLENSTAPHHCFELSWCSSEVTVCHSRAFRLSDHLMLRTMESVDLLSSSCDRGFFLDEQAILSTCF